MSAEVELSNAAALGVQILYAVFSMSLLASWVTQFNRLAGKQLNEVPTADITSIVLTGGLTILLVTESADPFGNLDIFEGWFLRFISITTMTGCAFWNLINGTHYASLLLVILGLKLKSAETGGKGPDVDERWDLYTYAKSTISITWMIMAIIFGVKSILQKEDFVVPMLGAILAGVCISFVFTAVGMKRSLDKDIGPAEKHITDIKNHARMKVSARIIQILVYHMLVVAVIVTDLVLGAPTGEAVEGKLTTVLIIYGACSRVFVAFQIWFNWMEVDERSFQQRLQDRRRQYKVVSVERVIDERVEIEQERVEQGHASIVDKKLLSKLVVFKADDYETPQTRNRGYTERYMQQAEIRMTKGIRTRASNIGFE